MEALQLESLKQPQQPPVTYFFSLYVDLRQFDKAVTQQVDPEILLEKAQEIRRDYLETGGDYYVQVRSDLVAATIAKIMAFEREIQYYSDDLDHPQQANNNTSRNKDSGFQSHPPPLNSGACQKHLLFIELLSFVLEKLKAYFEQFKRSPMFVELEDEISRQEKLYDILVDASIITK